VFCGESGGKQENGDEGGGGIRGIVVRGEVSRLWNQVDGGEEVEAAACLALFIGRDALAEPPSSGLTLRPELGCNARQSRTTGIPDSDNKSAGSLVRSEERPKIAPRGVMALVKSMTRLDSYDGSGRICHVFTITIWPTRTIEARPVTAIRPKLETAAWTVRQHLCDANLGESTRIKSVTPIRFFAPPQTTPAAPLLRESTATAELSISKYGLNCHA
jgi:hypothetical protein